MTFGWFKRKNDSEEVTDDSSDSLNYFKRLKERLSKTRDIFSGGIEKIFSGKNHINDNLLEELEELLITSDIGVQTATDLIRCVSGKSSAISGPDQIKDILKNEIIRLFNGNAQRPKAPVSKPHVIMVVGVNGVGKTTTIGKLATKFAASGNRVLIAAADTFRAAAVEQLSIWAERAGAEIVKHKDNADPAAVAYDGIEAALARNIDVVIVDTAGRLHTKTNLMEELKKIKRSISKKIPDAPHEILLVLDATTGQNSISQAKLFNEALGVTGIALTKLDGTAKGGIVISICNTFKLPIQYIGIGESIDDLQEFDPVVFVKALF
ncbi:MAG: signal recognition particle-docking protein FtsY [Pseudomonadota bacterium]|nr:signal recognition particle-docking protein FtsY [Pseudomonadota bacterium]MBU1570383.1 signal recognition particle-docking protein FtsY [Pseudomonadota bacterium]